MRDAQSLLDQALVQVEAGGQVTAPAVRDMLGLADRAQTIALFETLVRGRGGPGDRGLPHPLRLRRRPGDGGADLLEHCHGASPRQGDRPRRRWCCRRTRLQRLAAIGAAVSAVSLSRLWQMLLQSPRRGAPRARSGRRGGDGADPPLLRRRPARSRGGAEGAARGRRCSGCAVGARAHAAAARRRGRRAAPMMAARSEPSPADRAAGDAAQLRGRRRPDRRAPRHRAAGSTSRSTCG